MFPQPSSNKLNVAIVGAGLSGSLMAILLAKRGWQVTVYEKRADIRQANYAYGRSINLGLSARGIAALTAGGVIADVMDHAVKMRGRVVHGRDGTTLFQPYGKDDSEVLHSIDRVDLSRILIERADQFDNVTFRFQQQFVSLDKTNQTLCFQDTKRGTPLTVQADLVIGADGAFSKVRQQMQHNERAYFQQEFLDWGYKELTLPAGPGGTSLIEQKALHVWPRSNALIVSHANYNGSHTLTLFLPFSNTHYCFDTLRTEAEVTSFFQLYFPDLISLMPNLITEFFAHPTGKLVTINTTPWHYEDWIVLIGDACHAVYPFYGQGMNAALEDCLLFDEAINQHYESWNEVLSRFSIQRKPHTDVLAQLSKENFLELSDRLKSPLFVVRKRLNVWLNQLFPEVWLPLYTMVSHTTMPYGDALKRAKQQERWLKYFSLMLMASVSLLSWRKWWRQGEG